MSTSTERMRRLKERRRRGIRQMGTIEVDEMDILVLVTEGWLDEDDENNKEAVTDAIEAFLRESLIACSEKQTGPVLTV